MDSVTLLWFIPIVILLSEAMSQQAKSKRLKLAMRYGLLKISDEHGKEVSFDELDKRLKSQALRDELVLKQTQEGKLWTVEH